MDRKNVFTKPSRGTNDSERPTIIPVMNIARMSQVRCTGATGFDCRQGAETRRWRMSKKANWRRCRLLRGAVSGFTLAEGTTYVDMSDRCHRCAFTLAEVLITLGIIGVVAAMTIPSLMTKINDKINSNRMSVIEKRFLQGLNMLNTQDNGLNVAYASTEDFVMALSKHLKMTQICGKNELSKCLTYSKVYILTVTAGKLAAYVLQILI